MNHERIDQAEPKPGEVPGTVVSGTGRASFFTQLEWVKRQCRDKLGFDPYPGTFNLAISESDKAFLMGIRKFPGVSLDPPDKAYCSALVYPIQIGTIACAIIWPEESVRKHGDTVVEILAPVCLRDAFKVIDGERIYFSVQEGNSPDSL